MSSMPSECRQRKRPSTRLTVKQIISRCKRRKPATVEEALIRCYLPLQYLFAGSFRDVYHIVGSPLVIKIPNNEFGTHDSLNHSRAEVKWVKRLNGKKYAAFHRYLPRIYYANKKGVIVMRRYAEMENTKASRELCRKLEDDLKNCMNKPDAELDLRTDNMGRDDKGRPVILDLGLFSG